MHDKLVKQQFGDTCSPYLGSAIHLRTPYNANLMQIFAKMKHPAPETKRHICCIISTSLSSFLHSQPNLSIPPQKPMIGFTHKLSLRTHQPQLLGKNLIFYGQYMKNNGTKTYLRTPNWCLWISYYINDPICWHQSQHLSKDKEIDCITTRT